MKTMNYLDRNEFNFEPSEKVIEAIKNFDPRTLCFYTRIYDQGKKSVISVRLSEIYGVPEEQVLLGYGGEEMLKNAIHYFLMKGDNKTILIPEFSWWYYNRVAGECGGSFEMYPLYETGDTFAYNVDEVIAYTNRIHPRMLLLASPNNPTGNSLTSEEIGRIMENIPTDTMVLVDEAYASFITTDVDYIAPLVNKYNNLIISRTLSKFYGLPASPRQLLWQPSIATNTIARWQTRWNGTVSSSRRSWATSPVSKSIRAWRTSSSSSTPQPSRRHCRKPSPLRTTRLSS